MYMYGIYKPKGTAVVCTLNHTIFIHYGAEEVHCRTRIHRHHSYMYTDIERKVKGQDQSINIARQTIHGHVTDDACPASSDYGECISEFTHHTTIQIVTFCFSSMY